MSIAAAWQRQRQEVWDVVAPRLGGSELIRATLAVAQTGPSPMVRLSRTYGWALLFGRVKRFGVVATDERVFFVRRTTWGMKVSGVESVVPLREVRTVQWQPGIVYSVLRLERRHGELRLNLHRYQNPDAEALVRALA